MLNFCILGNQRRTHVRNLEEEVGKCVKIIHKENEQPRKKKPKCFLKSICVLDTLLPLLQPRQQKSVAASLAPRLSLEGQNKWSW